MSTYTRGPFPTNTYLVVEFRVQMRCRERERHVSVSSTHIIINGHISARNGSMCEIGRVVLWIVRVVLWIVTCTERIYAGVGGLHRFGGHKCLQEGSKWRMRHTQSDTVRNLMAHTLSLVVYILANDAPTVPSSAVCALLLWQHLDSPRSAIRSTPPEVMSKF
jgi:hypothetical protein